MAAHTGASSMIFLALCCYQVQHVLSVVWCDSVSYCPDGYYCCTDALCCRTFSAGTIAGLAIGVLLLIGLSIGIRYWLWKRSRGERVIIQTPDTDLTPLHADKRPSYGTDVY